ncbi:uncharacterized protein LOC117528108 isoform X2 [Thalassophryne amazonica]|uniref:uncharacterized protein LOC117528108 isoform X2 n=1 Tax=Thalassophryne amazonica TaxID=390379 RepID=UPI001471A803|nr:uncharacterized protein LOC117528108 isoform X2 [Thalassophryne amazonica]
MMSPLSDEGQSEVTFKIQPHPETKIQHNTQCDNTEETDDTTKEVSCSQDTNPEDDESPLPVHPPPSPPINKRAISTEDAATDESPEPTPPPVHDEKTSAALCVPPPRPPPPALYCDRARSGKRTEEDLLSKCSVTRSQSSSPIYEELMNFSVAHDESSCSENTEDDETPLPVRPPPSPPKSKRVISTEDAATDESPDPAPPAVHDEKTSAAPRVPPPRPPPPALYCDRARSGKKTEEDQLSKCSVIRVHSSPPIHKELVNLSAAHDEATSDVGFARAQSCPARSMHLPARCTTVVYGAEHHQITKAHSTLFTLPARQSKSTLHQPTSMSECSQLEDRPYLHVLPDKNTISRRRPPTFNPPAPPTTETQSDTESVYSKISYRPSVRSFSDDDDDRMSQGRSTPLFGQYQSAYFPPPQSASEDTEDIEGMLRWLKRVSKSSYLAPSKYNMDIEDEIRECNERAADVKKALRLYNLLMMKRNEKLRDYISEFITISDTLDKVHKKNKTIGIAGGTTGAVGGMTAVVGLALAPVTLGASLIATVVGAGMVASAGGMGAHAAKASKKIVNKKSVENLVCNYMTNIVDIEFCLIFILCAMNELRRHDLARLHRAGAPANALKMTQLSEQVFMDSMSNTQRKPAAHTGGMSSEKLLKAFDKEIDMYFSERNGQKLKKSCQSKFSGRVRLLGVSLQEELDYLNHMWEKFS